MLGRSAEIMKKKTAWFLRIFGVIFLLAIAGLIFAISCIPTSHDNGRFRSLLHDVEAHFEFTALTADGTRPAVYGAGLAYSDHIDIYGEYSNQEVIEIIEAVSDAQSRRSDKVPIEVNFYSSFHDDSTLYREVAIAR